jgi:hypothetical protein
MAKASSNNNKVSFGKRKGGRPTKFKGPKVKPTKAYRGQGK